MNHTPIRRPAAWRSVGLLLLGLVVACAGTSADTTRYHCPMHPTYVSNRPGDCPICGMRLVPIAEASKVAPEPMPTAAAEASKAAWICPMRCAGSDAAAPGKCPVCNMNLVPNPALAAPGAAPTTPAGLAPLALGEEGVRLTGVQTTRATRERLTRTVRAVGTVTADETRVRRVHTKIAGWVDKLYVDFTGKAVTRGQPLLTLYSPDLLASQQEYLRAREAAARFAGSSLPEVQKGGEELVAAARRRLELWDVPPGFLATIVRTGKPQRTVPVLAAASGVVTTKSVYEGQQIDPSMELFTLTDLSHVWVQAAVYEDEAAAVHVGQPAALTLASAPTVRRQAAITYVNPTLDPATRTVGVRLELDNPDQQLKPAMVANVELVMEAAEGVVVPDSAVLDTGLRKIVFVRTGASSFSPRDVEVGLRTGGRALVSRGLGEGDEVAVKATFLLDSESRLRAALQPAGVGHEP